jgi:hypothetical protein
MKRQCIALFLGCTLFVACEKNSVSKIPQISLVGFAPADSLHANIDTALIEFRFTDGDADIGNDTISVIHLKDSRFDTAGFVKYPFPNIDAVVEDPKKGVSGIVVFEPDPQPVPRDSLHGVIGDTLYYELYITDRAGHESNHITTHKIIVKN